MNLSMEIVEVEQAIGRLHDAYPDDIESPAYRKLIHRLQVLKDAEQTAKQSDPLVDPKAVPSMAAIERLRKRHEIPSWKLAAAAGLRAQLYYGFESGRRRAQLHHLVALAGALVICGVKPAEIRGTIKLCGEDA